MCTKSGSYGDVVVEADRQCTCGFYSMNSDVLRQTNCLKCVCCGTHNPRVVKTIRKELFDTDQDVSQMCKHEVFMTSVASQYGFALPVIQTGTNGCSFTSYHAGRSLDYALRHVSHNRVKALIFSVAVRAMQMGLCGIRHLDLNLGNVCIRQLNTTRAIKIFGLVFETEFEVNFIDFGISELREWCLTALNPDPEQYFPGWAANIEGSKSPDILASTAKQLCANFFKDSTSISWHLASSFSTLNSMVFHDAAQFVLCCYMHFCILDVHCDCLDMCETMFSILKKQTESDDHCWCVDHLSKMCGISQSFVENVAIHNLDTPIISARGKKRKCTNES